MRYRSVDMAKKTQDVVISAQDHGPLLAMTTWFLACTLFFCIAIRFGVRLTARNVPNTDDLLILISFILAIGGVVAVSFAVESGAGKAIFLLTPSALQDIQKEIWVITILYVMTIGISKIAMTTFLWRLSCTRNHRRSVVIAGILILCWTVIFTIGVFFQCDIPRPWALFGGKCVVQIPFWLTASIIDVATDLVMIILPIKIVSSLRLPRRKKQIVNFIFALRFILIMLSITRTLFLKRAIEGDGSFDGIPVAVLTQAHAILSVIIACSPTLKPFMDSMRTGMLSVSLNKRSAGTTFGRDSDPSRSELRSQRCTARSQGHYSAFRLPHIGKEVLGESQKSASTKGPTLALLEPAFCTEGRIHIPTRLSLSAEPAISTRACVKLLSPRPNLHSEPVICTQAAIRHVKSTPSLLPGPALCTEGPIRRQQSLRSKFSKPETPPRPPRPPKELRPDPKMYQPRYLGTNDTLLINNTSLAKCPKAALEMLNPCSTFQNHPSMVNRPVLDTTSISIRHQCNEAHGREELKIVTRTRIEDAQGSRT